MLIIQLDTSTFWRKDWHIVPPMWNVTERFDITCSVFLNTLYRYFPFSYDSLQSFCDVLFWLQYCGQRWEKTCFRSIVITLRQNLKLFSSFSKYRYECKLFNFVHVNSHIITCSLHSVRRMSTHTAARLCLKIFPLRTRWTVYYICCGCFDVGGRPDRVLSVFLQSLIKQSGRMNLLGASNTSDT
jgi:hypothetical protein